MTRVYGLTEKEQLKMYVATWSHYLNAIPFVMAFEQMRQLEVSYADKPDRLARKLQRQIREYLGDEKARVSAAPSITKQIGPLLADPKLRQWVKIQKKQE